MPLEKYNGELWREGASISVRQAEIWRKETFRSGFRWGALLSALALFLLLFALDSQAHQGRIMAVGETQARPVGWRP